MKEERVELRLGMGVKMRKEMDGKREKEKKTRRGEKGKSSGRNRPRLMMWEGVREIGARRVDESRWLQQEQEGVDSLFSAGDEKRVSNIHGTSTRSFLPALLTNSHISFLFSALVFLAYTYTHKQKSFCSSHGQ